KHRHAARRGGGGQPEVLGDGTVLLIERLEVLRFVGTLDEFIGDHFELPGDTGVLLPRMKWSAAVVVKYRFTAQLGRNRDLERSLCALDVSKVLGIRGQEDEVAGLAEMGNLKIEGAPQGTLREDRAITKFRERALIAGATN